MLPAVTAFRAGDAPEALPDRLPDPDLAVPAESLIRRRMPIPAAWTGYGRGST